jgi:hypothetical protein
LNIVSFAIGVNIDQFCGEIGILRG